MEPTLNYMEATGAYRLGQKNGLVAGIIATSAVYLLAKAYKPQLPNWKRKTKNTEEV
jgi:hypothetical protein